MQVYANIMCNDGTESPSCYDCHQGCCSHHDGCSKSSYQASYKTTKSYNNNITSNQNDSYLNDYYISDNNENKNVDNSRTFVNVIKYGIISIIGYKSFKKNNK